MSVTVKTAILALNGTLLDQAASFQVWFQRQRLQEPRYYAVDGGLRHFVTLGISPDMWLGDMDSSPFVKPYASCLDTLLEKTDIQTFPPTKNETDGELAALHALEQGCQNQIWLGAFSADRPDHVQANLCLAKRLLAEGLQSLIMTDGQSYLYLHDATQKLSIDIQDFGFHRPLALSLLALGSRHVTGLYSKGLTYPLDNDSLSPLDVRGVSNTFLPSTQVVHLSWAEGLLGIFLIFDDLMRLNRFSP